MINKNTKNKLGKLLLENSAVKHGKEFTLKSGNKTNYFIDFSVLSSVETLSVITKLYYERIMKYMDDKK